MSTTNIKPHNGLKIKALGQLFIVQLWTSLRAAKCWLHTSVSTSAESLLLQQTRVQGSGDELLLSQYRRVQQPKANKWSVQSMSGSVYSNQFIYAKGNTKKSLTRPASSVYLLILLAPGRLASSHLNYSTSYTPYISRAEIHIQRHYHYQQNLYWRDRFKEYVAKANRTTHIR